MRRPILLAAALLFSAQMSDPSPPIAKAGFEVGGSSDTDLAESLMARMGKLSTELERGHRALRGLDMDTAREVSNWIGSLDDTVREGVGVRYFMARHAYYEGRYQEGLTYLPPAQPDEGAGIQRLRHLLGNVARVTADFKSIETEHFIINYRPGPDEVMLPYLTDTLERSYRAIGSELGHLPEEKVRLEIYPTSADFIAVSGLTREEIQTTGIIALCVYNKLMVTSPMALANGYRWLDTASHEYIHQVVAQSTYNRVPVWLQEGLAKFFEVRWRGDRAAALSPMSESLLAEALRTGNFVPFEKMSPSVAKLPSQHEAQLAFAQVETFIEMIVQRKGLQGIRDLLAYMKEGVSDQESVGKVLGVGFPIAENQWKQFVAQKNPKQLAGIELMPIILQAQQVASGEEGGKITDPFMSENKAMQEFSRLGDLLRDRNRFKAALVEYKKAEGASPKESPALRVKIARTYMMGNNMEAAQEELESLLERYDSFGPAWTTLGQVRLQMGDSKGAIEAFEQAVASNPFDPFVHRSLAELYEQQGQKERAAMENKAVAILSRVL